MWNKKDLKRSARAALRANYLRCVVVSLLVMALAGGFAAGSSNNITLTLNNARLMAPEASNTQVVNEVARNLFGQESGLWQEIGKMGNASQGVLATLFNNATASGNFLFGFLNAINQLIFNDRVGAGIIIALGSVLVFLYYVLVENTLQVSQYRFYLENRRYTDTRVERVLFLYKIRRMGRVAWAMLMRAFFTVLWFFAIIGGFVALYAYRLVPLILAENPDIPAGEALRLSRRMMKGSKWRCFMLDLSFLGWRILGIFTFYLLEIFYVNPYYTAANAELYMRLRRRALETETRGAEQLNDPLLEGANGAPEKAEYPAEAFPIPERKGRRWLNTDYERSYSLSDYILLFFSFSIIGYLWEVGGWLVQTGELVNRGTMYGPWLPIYGGGGVVTLFLLRRFAHKPLLTFFLSMGVCGIIEYTSAWFLETFQHTKWWDYTGFFLNIQGRVCLEGLLVFGLGCCAGIYLLSPSLARLYEKISGKGRLGLCAALLTLFAADFAISAIRPNMAAGKAEGEAVSSLSAPHYGAGLPASGLNKAVKQCVFE